MSYELKIEVLDLEDTVRTFDTPEDAIEAGVRFMPQHLKRSMTDQEKALFLVQLLQWEETILYDNLKERYKIQVRMIGEGSGINLGPNEPF